jgi:catechol 2,3-dioxygenase-like lactoylglutathione lyase family enzyme
MDESQIPSPSSVEGCLVPIHSVLINVVDLPASIEFYQRHLGGVLVGDPDESGAVLDFETGTIRLRTLSAPVRSTWIADDLQAGFRHLGFKVSDLEARVAILKADGVPFHLDPIDAEGGVRISFFFDPDGTLLELVEGDLQYHEVFDREAVDADWALGSPTRPRLDHVAETVAALEHTEATYAAFGWKNMGGIHQPNDARGFEIAYLRSGDTSLEVFTYSRAPLLARIPQQDAPGFVAMDIGEAAAGTDEGGSDPIVVADSDGLQRLVDR